MTVAPAWPARPSSESSVAQVESFGAVGDGAADDSAAIQAALATGKRITGSPGKTYKVSSPLTLAAAGQVLERIKLKRANQSGTTEWITVRVAAADCRVRDVEIDGNKANYTTANWNSTSEILVTSGADRSVVERCYIHDFPGEGIQQGDCNDVSVARCVLENGNGNGIHYGSSGPTWRGGRVVYNKVKNVNLNTAVGHADGCVVLSNGIGDLLVHGNYLENGISGIGSLDSTDNLDVTITDNEIRSMTGTAIEGDNPSGQGAVNVLIQGNRIYDSVRLFINSQASGSAAFPSRWVIRGNLFSNTKIGGSFARHVLIEGNVFTGGGTTMAYIDVASPKYMTIAGNQFQDGQYALSVGDVFDTLSFKDNTCVNQNSRAVNIYGTGCVGANSITGNTIVNDATALAGYDGINIAATQNKISVKYNEIALNKGNSGMTISGSNTTVQGNTVRRGTASNSIRIGPASTSSWVKYNTTDLAISDGGTTTAIASNDVVI